MYLLKGGFDEKIKRFYFASSKTFKGVDFMKKFWSGPSTVNMRPKNKVE